MAKKANAVLEVKNLTKRFGPPTGGFIAVDRLSFSLSEGQILGFLGPNGAGKSTTIYCMLGLISKDEGEIRIFGKDFEKSRSEILKQVNYCSAEFNLPWNLSVWENLHVYSLLYEVPDAKKKILELLEIFEIADLASQKIRDLSLGQRARVNLCKALINRPRLLLLDEPMASMDPDVVDKGITLLKKIQREEGISILYTSHNMWEIEEIASEIIFVNHGKVVASGSPIELTKKVLKGAKEPNLREVFIHISREGVGKTP